MKFLKELTKLNESVSKKKKKDPRDKSADRYMNYVAGNMIQHDVCSGKDAGSIKVKK